jgi:serine/threonine-protein kinase
MFWIPDYPNLSGKRLFNVYPARFSSRQSCAEFLNSYSKREPGAYCAKASKNSNVSADRFYAR